MRTIGGLTLTLGALLAGCADGTEGTRPVTIDWGRSPYLSTEAGGSVEAVVELGGTALPPDVDVEVKAIQGGIVVDVPVRRIDGRGRVPVTLRPEAGASGAYVVTATAVVAGVVHSATTMVVVPR